MAPIRRYLRITRVSALEVRIYLEKPSDTPWLLSSRDPALPRIIKLIRPKILPKLREENDNSKKKGSKKKKNIKDVVSQDDFEVAIFLTDSFTRHSLITKHKTFLDKPPIQSTGTKMTGWLSNTKDDAIDLSTDGVPNLRKEDTSESVALGDLPDATAAMTEEPLLVQSSDDDDGHFQTQLAPSRSRRRARASRAALTPDPVPERDDKKKMAVNTSYDTFSIYGKILCLIVKRKRSRAVVQSAGDMPAKGSHMMEQWISTQAETAPDLDDIAD